MQVVVVSQHYPPDPSTTAAIMAAISVRAAQEAEVLVLSGTARSASPVSAGKPEVVEVRNWIPARPRCSSARWPNCCSRSGRLPRCWRSCGAATLTVLAPFMLPYAFAAAAKLKSAKSVLIMHDLYPDVLVMAGLLQPQSIVAKAMRALNATMFRALDAVVIIGRDTEKLLLRYRGMTRDKIRFIPNRAALERGVRAATLIIRIAVRFLPVSSLACPAISALPTIPSSCSRPRACCATTRISTSCCRAGGWGSIS